MSDYNSSLPIRTETSGDVAVKIVDKTITSQALAVAADGSIAITDNGASLTVDGTVELGATSLAALESITVQNGAGGSAVNIQDGGNSITVDGTVELGATSLAALESITVQNGSGASAVNIQDGGNSLTVDVAQGGNTMTVNADGSINVAIVTDVAGTEVANYTTSAALGATSSINHDYTVTAGKTLIMEQIFVSGSGKIKAQVLVNGSVKLVAFNSTANPTIPLPLHRMLKAAATQVVRITITNVDNQAQDVYSTLLGVEV